MADQPGKEKDAVTSGTKSGCVTMAPATAKKPEQPVRH